MQLILQKYNITSPLYMSLYGFLVLLCAYVFEYGFGYLPCELCLYQRLPWAIVIVLSALAFLCKNKAKTLLYISALTLALGACLAVFHAGVEYSFWQGLESCSSVVSLELDGALLYSLDTQTVPRCDKASWTLFGISMAGYNAMLSIDASIFAVLLARLQSNK